MKHIVKIMSLVVAIAAFWIGLLVASVVPRNYGWLLPIYLIVSLGCYGLLMVGVGLMRFPTYPQEAGLLQKMTDKHLEAKAKSLLYGMNQVRKTGWEIDEIWSDARELENLMSVDSTNLWP